MKQQKNGQPFQIVRIFPGGLWYNGAAKLFQFNTRARHKSAQIRCFSSTFPRFCVNNDFTKSLQKPLP